tara:strand:+ start:131 stop:1174 length:1044 start_codon:yes stop_codon:yes gene_type:complete
MFRKGGSAGEGITSGLRQGYAEPGSVKQNDLSKIDIRNMNMQQLKDLAEQVAYKAPPMAPDNSMRDFKIDFGLDLISRSPQGNIFQTAAAAAKEPFANFRNSRATYNKGVQDRSINKYNSESDMFKTLIGAQSDILGSETGGKTYRDLEIARQLEQIIPKIYEIQARVDDGTATDDDLIQLDILKTQKNNYTKSNPVTEGAIELFIKSPQGQTLFASITEEMYDNDTSNYESESDPQLYIDAIEKIKMILGQFSGGGRAGYAAGEMVEEQVTETETMAPGPMDNASNNLISYDQLRARLPAEITDDIVELMTNSAEALEDFAMISTQADVEQFNRKYSVNLVLPAEA